MWTWVWRSSSALPRAASTRKRVRPSVIAYHDHFAHIETGNVFDPALLEELAPAADRSVVEKRRMGGLQAAPPMSKSTKAARRVTRQGEDRATHRSTRRDLLRRGSQTEFCAQQYPPNRKPREIAPGSSISRDTAVVDSRR
jgi:hypothetical protein